MIRLPDGYYVGKNSKRVQTIEHRLVGDNWQFTVWYDTDPAFEVVKNYVYSQQAPVYAGRLYINGDKWQKFDSIPEMIRVMCTKHKLMRK